MTDRSENTVVNGTHDKYTLIVPAKTRMYHDTIVPT